MARSRQYAAGGGGGSTSSFLQGLGRESRRPGDTTRTAYQAPPSQAQYPGSLVAASGMAGQG